MARQPRLDLPGSLQLVSAQGIGRCLIFRDDKDRMSFIAKLQSLLEETQTQCHAWSLLPKSFHLLLGIDMIPLSTVMRRLITAYASIFNHKYRRIGPLFYSRYKSTLCEKEPHFLELVRQVHLKPLQGGVVKNLSELDKYPWSSHYALMNSPEDASPPSGSEPLRPSQSLTFAPLHSDEVLLRFSSKQEEARQMYSDFMKKGTGEGKSQLFPFAASADKQTSWSSYLAAFADMPSDRRILGSKEFVSKTLKEAGELTGPKRISLQDLDNKIRCHFDVDEEQLRSPIKKKLAADAKAVFCYLAIRKMGYYGVEVGNYLNMRGISAIRAAERGKTIFQTSGLDPYQFL